MKNVNIVSVHFGHNATVAYLRNGKIEGCVSEERFNRMKNSTGFPELALDYIRKKFTNNIDYYVMTQHSPGGYSFLKKCKFKSVSSAPFVGYGEENRKMPWLLKYFPDLYYKKLMRFLKNVYPRIEKHTWLVEEMNEYFSKTLGVGRDKLLFLDHHLSHALATRFFQKNINDEILIFTLDGEGDGLSGTITTIKNGKINVISKINRVYSLGYLYSQTTAYLGMKPNEHEFKVMGLAPYAKKEHAKKIIPVFEKSLWLNDKDEFESNIPMQLSRHYLKEKLSYQRFDNIACALQEFTENITIEWIKRWIKKTGIKNIGVAGGVFMNVKMNQKIAELKDVESLTIVPSAGDESTVFGGCYYGYEKYCRDNNLEVNISRIENLYLGTSYTEREIEDYLKQGGYFNKYEMIKPDNINRYVAELLAVNQIVARFSGAMEFGARALGNRSILSNPSNYENIKIINDMIKNRDFWMPFAATILEDDAQRYLINSKNIEAPFMTITFNTTSETDDDIPAALHSYDKTSRPQILKKSDNPDYYELINEFKKITGIGAVLNTSFNLHGEPNVESPKDALYTFENSGLQYLAIGPFIVKKSG